MVKAQIYVYAKVFEGEPKLSDFDLVEEELPALQDGEFLAEAIYLSVDPYMRPYMSRFPVGTTMVGGQVAKIIDSKNEQFPVGTTVFGQFGWRTHTVFDPTKIKQPSIDMYVLPSFGDHSLSLALGMLGMPGITAHFGFLEICHPKEGETVVVTGAAGAIGSLVGQIAKARGCKVVGLAGNDAKLAWLKEIGFDHVINYKTADVSKALAEAVPEGYDCYFDNVGGLLSSKIQNQMRSGGRISVCGAISSYNDYPSKTPKVPILQPLFVFKQLKMEGFQVWRWADRWLDGILTMLDLVNNGKLKYKETRTNGFINMPKAFIGMLRGENTGKALVVV